MTRNVPLAERPITVFVRKGEKADERLLSFRRPEDIPPQHILTAGMALDGNAVLTGIGFDRDQGVYRHAPMGNMADLTPDQVDLAKILRLDIALAGSAEGSSSDEGTPPRGCYTLGHASLADALNCLESQLTVWLYAYRYSPEFT